MMNTQLKVLGTHCYLGGFLIGLQNAGMEVVGSAETWKPGAKGATALGLPVSTLDEVLSNPPDTDIVVGNPPCSRFSHLSLSFFKDREGSHEDPETFPEIMQLRDVCLSSGARILWWETGPLSWSLGRELIREYHDMLRAFWGKTTTLIVRLGLRYIGIPQRRPRVHVIHIATDTPPPSASASLWPTNYTIGEWLDERIGNRKLVNPVVTIKDEESIENPLQWAHEQDLKQKFRSMVPKIVQYNDQYALAVISRRVNVWHEDNRWWDFLEYAALMTYPLDKSLRLLEIGKRPVDAEVLLAKSVAPAASQWVAENILLPWLDNDRHEKHNPQMTTDNVTFGMVSPGRWGTNLWELDLSVGDRGRRGGKHDKRQLSPRDDLR